MKRLIAEVPDEFFWEVKQTATNMQLKQKTVVILAVRQFLQIKTPLVDLIDPEEFARLVALEMVEV